MPKLLRIVQCVDVLRTVRQKVAWVKGESLPLKETKIRGQNSYISNPIESTSVRSEPVVHFGVESSQFNVRNKPCPTFSVRNKPLSR